MSAPALPTGRRALLAGAAALMTPAVASRSRAAGRFVFKYGSNLPSSHPLNRRVAEAAERLKAATGGQLDIRLFPDSALGTDTDMLSQLRSGALEFVSFSGLVLSTLVPAAGVDGVGFAFTSLDQVWQAMDGKVGEIVRGEIARHGILAFDRMWDSGFRQITAARKAIAGPADLAGFKIRVPFSPPLTALFKALGASPTSLNFADVYPALQSHEVDGEENPLAVIETAKFYEVQKHLALTNHVWDGYWFLANQAAFARMPDDMQTIVRQEFDRAALLERQDLAAANDALPDRLASQGMTVGKPDPAPFREKLRQAGFYTEAKKRIGEPAWAALEAVVGKLA